MKPKNETTEQRRTRKNIEAGLVKISPCYWVPAAEKTDYLAAVNRAVHRLKKKSQNQSS